MSFFKIFKNFFSTEIVEVKPEIESVDIVMGDFTNRFDAIVEAQDEVVNKHDERIRVLTMKRKAAQTESDKALKASMKLKEFFAAE
jgi:hypothetical protein